MAYWISYVQSANTELETATMDLIQFKKDVSGCVATFLAQRRACKWIKDTSSLIQLKQDLPQDDLSAESVIRTTQHMQMPGDEPCLYLPWLWCMHVTWHSGRNSRNHVHWNPSWNARDRTASEDVRSATLTLTQGLETSINLHKGRWAFLNSIRTRPFAQEGSRHHLTFELSPGRNVDLMTGVDCKWRQVNDFSPGLTFSVASD